MASLLAPRNPEPRLSQILPTVKCSDCGQPVSLDQLGEHKCAPAPKAAAPPPTAVPAAPKPPAPAAAAPAPPAARPAAGRPPAAPAPAPKAAPGLPPPTRNPAALLPERLKNLVANQQGRTPSPGPGPAPDPRGGKPPFASQAPPPGNNNNSSSVASRSPPPSNSTSSRSPPPSNSTNSGSPPPSNGMSSRSPPPARAQAPPVLTRSPSPYNDRPVPSTSAPGALPPPRMPPPMRSMTPQVMARPPPDLGRERPASSASMHPRMPPLQPPGPGAFLGAGSSRADGHRDRSASAAPALPLQNRQPPPPPIAPSVVPPLEGPEEYVETRIGGEAGMAGVGRRGFAAAARAAMFAAAQGQRPGDGFMQPFDHARMMTPQPLGMDGRRGHAPQPLNLANIGAPRATTPPLSPESQSAYSPRSSVASPHEGANAIPKPIIPSSSEPFVPRGRTTSSSSISPLTPLTPADSGTPGTPRLPFFEKFKAATTPIVAAAPKPPPPPTDDGDDSGSEYGGLAYARSEASSTDRPPSTVRFPGGAGSPPRTSSRRGSGAGPTRSVSSASSYSSRTAGALGRGLDALSEDEDEDATLGDAIPARVPPVRHPTSPAGGSERSVRLPQRALTGPASLATSGAPRARRRRVCVHCDDDIGDGRWIQTDGAGVLCERCWKKMYLPRCRRCNLTIEKAAVSSADGQLKGKYHRECFNCHTCQKPFPDKSFYVFEGRPYCQLHYHEANESLCAAALCGQPIEGPCAVSHAGDRYHPEHLVCEYAGCDERLLDYWEVDGRMLCDRHARRVEEEGADGEQDAHARRAMKRKTRLINLDAAAGLR